jgi:HK97 family phage major capsid protein
VCGDFSFYHIADAEQMTVQRLVELYAETGQVGFIGTRALDAMPVLAEAFSRLKIA